MRFNFKIYPHIKYYVEDEIRMCEIEGKIEEQQKEFDLIFLKHKLQDKICVDLIKITDHHSKQLDIHESRLIGIYNDLYKIIKEKTTKIAVFIFELIQMKKTKRGDKIRYFEV